MAIAENIQTMQGFLGYFDPAQAERMARGCRAQIRTDVENAKGDTVNNREMHTAIAENIQTMQTFLVTCQNPNSVFLPPFRPRIALHETLLSRWLRYARNCMIGALGRFSTRGWPDGILSVLRQSRCSSCLRGREHSFETERG